MSLRPRIVLALLLPIISASAQDRNYGRSMVANQGGVAATQHPLASQAAAMILSRGGSAVDAVIAANAVTAVVMPTLNGIGGDLFAIYYEAKTGKLTGLNASGWAPRGLTIDFLKSKGLKEMPYRGIHSVSVPGSVSGWKKMHERFGRLPWKDLFATAIRYADQGHALSQGVGGSISAQTEFLSKDEEAKSIYIHDGKGLRSGDVLRNPNYAKALRLIAEQGPDAFYKGDIARAIVRTSQKHGGTMSLEDLAQYSAQWVEPISTDYRGWKVTELPPNGQGMAVLSMLNIMEQSPASPDGPHGLFEMHKKIEAMKLAYADLARYLADPEFSPVPVARLIAKPYAAERFKLIDANKANCNAGPALEMTSETTYMAVVDREGNIASWIQSNFAGFGSGVFVDGMGFGLQNRAALFVLDPKHPNALAGHKRPYHTIIPAILEKGDEHIGFGIMGGHAQAMSHAQFVSNIVDYGMNIQEALYAPRFSQAKSPGCNIAMEFRVRPDVVMGLSLKGHVIDLRKEYSGRMGVGNAVLHNSRTKVNFGAADPRSDGQVIPEPVL